MIFLYAVVYICFCKSKKDCLWHQIKKRKMVFKKCLNHSITLLQQSSNKRYALSFRYFGYKMNIEKFQICQKKRAFHLNKAHYLKPYNRGSVYRDRKLQCVDKYKYISKKIRSC